MMGVETILGYHHTDWHRVGVDPEGLEKGDAKEKEKGIIDKQEHTPHAFSEVSTKVEYDQNRQGTIAVYGNQSSKTPACTSVHSAATTGVVINEQLYPCTAAPPGTISNLPGHARRVCLCRQHPHPSNNTSNSPPSTPKRLPLQSTASNCTHALPANSDSDLQTYKGSLPSADYTLVHQTQPPQHFHPRRRDCLCSRQRAAPHSKNSSQHGPPPTRLPVPNLWKSKSSLPTRLHSRKPAQTTPTLPPTPVCLPLQSSTRDCEPSAQPSEPLRRKRSPPSQKHSRRCPGREIGESAREDANRSSTGRYPREKKKLLTEGKDHPRAMPSSETWRVCQRRHRQEPHIGRRSREWMEQCEKKKDVRTRIWTGVSAIAEINSRRRLHPWRTGMRLKARLRSLPVQTSTGAIHERRQKDEKQTGKMHDSPPVPKKGDLCPACPPDSHPTMRLDRDAACLEAPDTTEGSRIPRQPLLDSGNCRFKTRVPQEPTWPSSAFAGQR
jgi:hypothetical protein